MKNQIVLSVAAFSLFGIALARADYQMQTASLEAELSRTDDGVMGLSLGPSSTVEPSIKGSIPEFLNQQLSLAEGTDALYAGLQSDSKPVNENHLDAKVNEMLRLSDSGD